MQLVTWFILTLAAVFTSAASDSNSSGLIPDGCYSPPDWTVTGYTISVYYQIDHTDYTSVATGKIDEGCTVACDFSGTFVYSGNDLTLTQSPATVDTSLTACSGQPDSTLSAFCTALYPSSGTTTLTESYTVSATGFTLCYSSVCTEYTLSTCPGGSDDSGSGGASAGAIVGATIGALVACGCLSAAAYFWYKHKFANTPGTQLARRDGRT